MGTSFARRCCLSSIQGYRTREGPVAARGADPRGQPRSVSRTPEILANALIVLFGGIETTESTILNVLWTLLSHPEALAAIRAVGR